MTASELVYCRDPLLPGGKIAGLLYVSPRDVQTFAAVVLTLLTVALLANLLPARRAARADPVVFLRWER